MNLILCEASEVDADGLISLAGARAAHIRGVLRAKPGDTVRIGIVDGPRGRGEVVALDDSRVVLRCELDTAVAPAPAVDLLLAVPRPKVLRRLWAQLAALGVGRIILTNAARVERQYFDTHVLEESTWRPLLIEGLQQAGDTRLPRVSIHRQFRILIEDELAPVSSGELRLVAHPGGDRSAARRRARAAASSRDAGHRAGGRLERLRAGAAEAARLRGRSAWARAPFAPTPRALPCWRCSTRRCDRRFVLAGAVRFLHEVESDPDDRCAGLRYGAEAVTARQQISAQQVAGVLIGKAAGPATPVAESPEPRWGRATVTWDPERWPSNRSDWNDWPAHWELRRVADVQEVPAGVREELERLGCSIPRYALEPSRRR